MNRRLPPIRYTSKWPAVDREYPAESVALGDTHQRGVREVHRLIEGSPPGAQVAQAPHLRL